MLHDVGMVGLAATMNVGAGRAGRRRRVLGCGPLGVSAVQGARIKGAARIVAVDPIRYRRELARKLGATHVLDPNVEGSMLVQKVQEICNGQTDRRTRGRRQSRTRTS